MAVLLPERVALDMEREVQADAQIAEAMALTVALKEYDPDLEVVWASERADAPGLIPARWHVKRKTPVGEADLYMPITGPDGEFRELDSGVLEEVRQRDLQRMTQADMLRELRQRRDRKEAEKERERKLRVEQRAENIAQDVRAAKRVPGDGGLEKRRWGAK